jgi:4-nitrophenyl phosphatase
MRNSLESKLANIRCFVLDMDGTFFLGDHLLPGSLEFIDLLEKRSIPFIFLTNNSSKSSEQYARKIRSLGLEQLRDDQILTSGEATTLYVKKHYPDATIFVVGTPALECEFKESGFTLTDENPQLIVLGFDTTINYEKIWKLCDLVRSDLPYIATHPDINCPIEGGFMPDIGSIIALVEASTGRKPDVTIGKPFSPIVDALVEKTNIPVDGLAMVGDRLYTDVALGKTGMITILVLSGETKLIDLEKSVYQPDVIVDDLAGLKILLEGM